MNKQLVRSCVLRRSMCFQIGRVFLFAIAIEFAIRTTSVYAGVTFNKEIAPIIFQNCTSCHRPGEAAPFGLQTFSDVKKRGKLIADVVARRLMPPWKADETDYAFRYERRLTHQQIQTILSWVDEGMPEGEPSDLPEPVKFTPGWILGEPDLVIKMEQPFQVPADGPDIYRNFVIPLNLERDRWVKAIDFHPGARSVVHHSLFFFESAGLARKLENEDPVPGFAGGMGGVLRLRSGFPGALFSRTSTVERLISTLKVTGLNRLEHLNSPSFGTLGGWALGTQLHELPSGLAFRLPVGADLILSTHFHPSGKAEQEASTLGFYFSGEPTTREFMPIQLPPLFGAFKGIDIPAGAKNYEVEDSFVLPVDIEAFGVMAHAHYLGKSMRLVAELPDGIRKNLFSISDWDFAWQEQYHFSNNVCLPKGTVLHSQITYDNSFENPRNPVNPPVRVRFGEESNDEMGCVTLMVMAAKESDMPRLREAFRDHFRKAIQQTPLYR